MEGKLRLEFLDPTTLDDNPKNWRKHPRTQSAVLDSLISKRVGWAGALLYNEATGRLIDGHERKRGAIARGEPTVPVLIGSWTEEQEAELLATYDPVGDLAMIDPEAWNALLSEVSFNDADIDGMLAELSEDAGLDGEEEEPAPVAVAEPVSNGEEEDEEAEETPAVGLSRPTMQYTLVFDDKEQQEKWYAFLGGLREKYPDTLTIGGRITRFIESAV